jgi:hypothetical protein
MVNDIVLAMFVVIGVIVGVVSGRLIWMFAFEFDQSGKPAMAAVASTFYGALACIFLHRMTGSTSGRKILSRKKLREKNEKERLKGNPLRHRNVPPVSWALERLCSVCKGLISEKGHALPQDPIDQLLRAILAVYKSWNSERVVAYRQSEKISRPPPPPHLTPNPSHCRPGERKPAS